MFDISINKDEVIIPLDQLIKILELVLIAKVYARTYDPSRDFSIIELQDVVPRIHTDLKTLYINNEIVKHIIASHEDKRQKFRYFEWRVYRIDKCFKIPIIDSEHSILSIDYNLKKVFKIYWKFWRLYKFKQFWKNLIKIIKK